MQDPSITRRLDAATTAAADPISDELALLELRVAKRADELARNRNPNREQDIEFWNQAEQDVFSAGR
jgi:hypothetical protein